MAKKPAAQAEPAKTKAVATVPENTGVTRPDFMVSDTANDTSLELLNQFTRPPLMKIVQKQSKAEYTDVFNPGDVILATHKLLIAPVEVDEKTHKPGKVGLPFSFIPLFFYPEYIQWNDIKSGLPAIRYRTLNPADQVAVKARNPETRFEVIDKVKVRNVEHLVFIVLLAVEPDHPLYHIPVVMNFSRSEHKRGQTLASLAKLRKCPLYGGIYEAQVGYRANDDGEWFGYDVTNPINGYAFVSDKNEYELFKRMHISLKQAHDTGALVADMDDESEVTLDGTAKATVDNI